MDKNWIKYQEIVNQVKSERIRKLQAPLKAQISETNKKINSIKEKPQQVKYGIQNFILQSQVRREKFKELSPN